MEKYLKISRSSAPASAATPAALHSSAATTPAQPKGSTTTAATFAASSESTLAVPSQPACLSTDDINQVEKSLRDAGISDSSSLVLHIPVFLRLFDAKSKEVDDTHYRRDDALVIPIGDLLKTNSPITWFEFLPTATIVKIGWGGTPQIGLLDANTDGWRPTGLLRSTWQPIIDEAMKTPITQESILRTFKNSSVLRRAIHQPVHDPRVMLVITQLKVDASVLKSGRAFFKQATVPNTIGDNLSLLAQESNISSEESPNSSDLFRIQQTMPKFPYANEFASFLSEENLLHYRIQGGASRRNGTAMNVVSRDTFYQETQQSRASKPSIQELQVLAMKGRAVCQIVPQPDSEIDEKSPGTASMDFEMCGGGSFVSNAVATSVPTSFGSGFLITPFHLVTCFHNLYDWIGLQNNTQSSNPHSSSFSALPLSTASGGAATIDAADTHMTDQDTSIEATQSKPVVPESPWKPKAFKFRCHLPTVPATFYFDLDDIKYSPLNQDDNPTQNIWFDLVIVRLKVGESEKFHDSSEPSEPSGDVMNHGLLRDSNYIQLCDATPDTHRVCLLEPNQPLEEKQQIFIFGFPAAVTAELPLSHHLCVTYRFNTITDFWDWEMLYTPQTWPGMSGGPGLLCDGRLVCMHRREGPFINSAARDRSRAGSQSAGPPSALSIKQSVSGSPQQTGTNLANASAQATSSTSLSLGLPSAQQRQRMFSAGLRIDLFLADQFGIGQNVNARSVPILKPTRRTKKKPGTGLATSLGQNANLKAQPTQLSQDIILWYSKRAKSLTSQHQLQPIEPSLNLSNWIHESDPSPIDPTLSLIIGNLLGTEHTRNEIIRQLLKLQNQ